MDTKKFEIGMWLIVSAFILYLIERFFPTFTVKHSLFSVMIALASSAALVTWGYGVL